MKKGCLFLLAVLVAASAGYYYLFQGTELSDNWWAPIGLGVGAAIVVANFLGIVAAIRQRQLSKRSPSEWRDGDKIVVSGRLQPQRGSITAPFSGKSATIVHYEVSRMVKSGDSSNSQTDFSGYLMTPCTVQTKRGALRLVGFPLLAQVSAEVCTNDDAYLRAANYLQTCQFQEQSANPLKALAALNEVLADDDGDLRIDFRASRASLPEFSLDQAAATEGAESETLEDEDDREEREADQARFGAAANEVISGINQASIDPRDQQLAAALASRGYSLKETVVPSGAEVTLTGLYVSGKNQINIGSGIKYPSHGVQLGNLTSVLGRNLRRAFIGFVFWTGAFGAGNWYLLKYLGYID